MIDEIGIKTDYQANLPNEMQITLNQRQNATPEVMFS